MSNENSKKDYSKLQERTISESLGWSTVSGSGSRHTYPGDVISSDWLGECKTHTHATDDIRFDYKVWSKIQEEAFSKFRRPVLFVDAGTQKLKDTWCMLHTVPNVFCAVTECNCIHINNSSVTFKHSDMQDYQSRLSSTHPVVYVLNTPVGVMYLMHFTEFMKMLNEG